MRFLLIITLLLSLQSMAQTSVTKSTTMTSNTVVKDTSGKVYEASEWRDLLMSGKCTIKAVNSGSKVTEYLLVFLSEDEQKSRLENMPKPGESKFFTTGAEMANFSGMDMNGENYSLNSLRGKVVVLNFWYIACAPCQAEIPELNKVVSDYKDSSDIVFISVCLDEESMIRKFLEKKPFDYKIIHDGRPIASIYGVKGYPTHVVLNREGKITFHTSGYGMATTPWLRKSIASALNP